MKKVIEGRLCNTETAKLVGYWKSAGSRRDFSYCEESLYLTRAGQYFLHGEGGPMSRYAKSSGQSSWTGGEDIILLSRAAAAKWAEENLEADDYAKAFGAPEEAGDGMETLIVGIPAALKERLRVAAQESGVSMTAIVIEALTTRLA